MDFEAVMKELEALGTDRTKKIYLNHGAHEPSFGVATGDMRSIAKKIKRNQALAEELYSTGNYDAMYFAGMIADPKVMSEEDFERWIKDAYFFMLSDYVVAVSLAETDFAQNVADRWINSDEELYQSAGWACYEWLLGSRLDDEFDSNKLRLMLDTVRTSIHECPERVKYSMNNFLIAVGVSYLPLHEEAMNVALEIGEVSVTKGKIKYGVALASESIQKAVDKKRLGFKRKSVRC